MDSPRVNTPSPQWNNYLRILWLHSQSVVALFVCILNCGQAVIRMFNRLSVDKQEIDVLFQTGQAKVSPYPEPVYTGWSNVHWNATGMPLVDPVYTGIPLGDPANTCRVHWNTTGKT